MSNTHDLLVEIGTEELPPKALKRLATSFADEIVSGLEKQDLGHTKQQWFASPRRLTVLISDLIDAQADKEVQRRGPALAAAYDADGNPTKAAEGFARSCGVSVEELLTLETDKGSWLSYDSKEVGQATVNLLEDIISSALRKLPIPKRMRWGDGEAEFVRPIHWIMILFGSESVKCSILDVEAGRTTRGHRFHHPETLEIDTPSSYVETLRNKGSVIVDYHERQQLIREAVESAALTVGGVAIINDDLLDEVTALVEWPEIICGGFDKQFLELPEEVLIASMQDHQKYFPVRNKDGSLSPHFLTVANIKSHDAEEIRKGNERVIHPRLSDAAFFWKRDTAKPLADYSEGLKDIIYQKKLGSLFEKSVRVEKLATHIAELLNIDSAPVQRAAMLAKCDLLTDMVGEFPELQGTMGRYYANKSGEDNAVALALDEQYMPRFAGDTLPSGDISRCLAIADKLDSLLGIFAIGQIPTGDKDPFALRRAALGCLRIMIECELDIDLFACLQQAAQNFDDNIKADEAVNEVFNFMSERLRRYYADLGLPVDVFESVLSLKPHRPFDFHRRAEAVRQFSELKESANLAAANKRIQNILKQSEDDVAASVDTSLFQEQAEKDLWISLEAVSNDIQPLLADSDYVAALKKLASLGIPVDCFFDEVMVMSDDKAIKANRLALLGIINAQFMHIADISKLQSK